MGSIIERTKKSGAVSYQAMVKIPGSKAAVKTFDEREMAQAFIDNIERQRALVAKARMVKSVTAIEPEDEVQRAKDAQRAWANSWLKECIAERKEAGDLPERDARSIGAVVRLAGDVKLAELDRKWVKGFKDRARKVKTRRGGPYAWSSIIDLFNIVKSTMSWRAEELGAVGARLKFAKADLPEDWDVRRERRLSKDEERRLIRRFMSNRQKTRRRHWIRIFRLALNTAARMQELHLAEWSEFNLDGRFWTIPAAHTKKKRTRVVPLNRAAMRALRAMWLIRDPQSPRVFHVLGNTHSLSNCFYHLTLNMGLEDLRFHDLRHEAISRMVLTERQLRVSDIMKIVGHSSIEMLERYSNLRGDELASQLIN